MTAAGTSGVVSTFQGPRMPLWLPFGAIAACVVLIPVLFWGTTASMVALWRQSETYQHCFAVAPIALWLVWTERARLACEPLEPFWPGLVALVALGVLWLVGQLGAAQVLSHFALAGMISAFVLTVFGLRWIRIVWFPLAFLFFAVPFGEALVPRLMDWTADVTVAAVSMSGVPVYREGTHFVIPSGQWSVIEACSGIKFLIASIMAGSLYAWLMYRSLSRRLLFVAASVGVPILANWLRAYSVVMIGHLSQNRLMNNEDHIVFGWILFGAIMVLMYWIGARWREDNVVASTQPAAESPAPARQNLVAVAVAAASAIAVWPLIAQALAPASVSQSPTFVTPLERAGWQRDPSPVSDWVPELTGVSKATTFVYRKGNERVAVFVAAFTDQSQAAQVGSSANQLVRSSNSNWKQTAVGTRVLDASGESGVGDRVRTAQLRGGGERLVVWQWYWSGGAPTSSAAMTKVDLVRARLLRQPDTALWVALYTPAADNPTEAETRLLAFARDMGASLRQSFVEATTR